MPKVSRRRLVFIATFLGLAIVHTVLRLIPPTPPKVTAVWIKLGEYEKYQRLVDNPDIAQRIAKEYRDRDRSRDQTLSSGIAFRVSCWLKQPNGATFLGVYATAKKEGKEFDWDSVRPGLPTLDAAIREKQGWSGMEHADEPPEWIFRSAERTGYYSRETVHDAPILWLIGKLYRGR
jgi:hypothetical protein